MRAVPLFVIPANAGIARDMSARPFNATPAFAGVTVRM